MIESFADSGTAHIFRSRRSKAARETLPTELHRIGRRKLAVIDYADELGMLRVPPGNRLEALRGIRKTQYSIRINERYRICFRWQDGRAFEVQIVDYH